MEDWKDREQEKKKRKKEYQRQDNGGTKTPASERRLTIVVLDFLFDWLSLKLAFSLPEHLLIVILTWSLT